MIVHLIASKSKIIDQIEYYREIKRILEKHGHSLAYDWIEEAYEIVTNSEGNRFKVDDWVAFDRKNLESIAKSDVIIVEATTKTFFTGYNVGQAAQLKKPILILMREGLYQGLRQLKTGKEFIQGEQYDLSTLEDIILGFLEDNTIEVKDMRFNFFIDRKIYNYLRWAAFRTGKTKAEIIRELVMKEIDKKDF